MASIGKSRSDPGGLAILLAVTGAVCLQARTVQQPKPTPADDPEAYAVYASLLPNEWTVTVAKAKRLVVQEETETNWTCMPSGKPLETDWKPVLDSYKAANASVRSIRANQSLGFPYDVVPSVAISKLMSDRATPGGRDWWQGFGFGFGQKYPESGGYLQLSAVGFDPDHTRAMVYVAHYCGPMCGGGMHHLLEKIDGVWREANIDDLIQCVWDS